MNKKRPRFQVDEEKLKKMMAGDIPIKVEPSDLTIIHEEEEQAKENREAESSEAAAPAGEKKNTGEDKAGKKRKTDLDKYMEVFLAKPPTKLRRQRTFMLEEELYIKISRMIKYTPGGITFPGFLINVINHHFEQHKDEVNEMLRLIANDILNPNNS